MDLDEAVGLGLAQRVAFDVEEGSNSSLRQSTGQTKRVKFQSKAVIESSYSP